jgi:hypothetical protein
MIGHNRLLVAYEDGHSVATMQRTYAAWTKGAKPEDVELIKQAMAGRPTTYDGGDDSDRRHRRRYRHKPPQSPKAATTLPLEPKKGMLRVVARALGLQRGRALGPCSTGENERKGSWLGWKDSNLRMAGSKDSDQHNQQVAEITDRRVPSSPFDSPSLPPNLPPAIGETAVVLGPARGTTNYLLLSANLRRPTGPCHVTPIRPQAHQRVARVDPKESQKVALRLINRGRGAAWESPLAARGNSAYATSC